MDPRIYVLLTKSGFDVFHALNWVSPGQAPTDGTLGTDILLRGSVRAQSPNLGTAGLRNRALAGNPFTSILQPTSPSKLLNQVNSGVTVPRQQLDVQLFDINSASKANLVAMLSRLRGEDVNGAKTADSSTQDAVEQLIGAQRLEKEEELEEKVLGQNLLGGEIHVEEELQDIVREAMRQVE